MVMNLCMCYDHIGLAVDLLEHSTAAPLSEPDQCFQQILRPTYCQSLLNGHQRTF